MATKKIIEVDLVESLSNDDAIFVNSNNSLKQILKSNLTVDGGYYAPAVDDNGNLTWTASKTGMPDVAGANIKGPKGDTGPAGTDGKSAYAYAVEGGYTGTEEEFAAKLAQEYPAGIAEATGGTVTEGNLVVWDADRSLVRDGGAVPEKLPNPNALTFTGAVAGSYDGSEAVTVEIPSGGGSGGSGKTLTLIAELTLETETGFTISQDSDGNPISENELIVTAYIPAVSANRDINMSVRNGSGSWVSAAAYGLKTGTSAFYHEHRLWATGEYLIDKHSQATSLGPAVSGINYHRMVSFDGKICGIGSNYLTPPAGSVIKLYAWR